MPQKNNLVPTWWSQKSFSEFKTEYEKPENRLLLFIGSGISRWANLPDWKGLLLDLAVFYDQLNPASNLVSEVKSRLADVKNDPLKYQEVGTFLKRKFNSPDVWRKALTHILDNRDTIEKSSEIHNIIAKLRWFRIVTPNYDRLIEQAIRSSTDKAVEVTHPWKNPHNAAYIENCEHPCIFKIHGDIADSRSQIVLTKDDYDELYGVDEHSDPISFKRTLGAVLRSAKTILFMGYSHDDPYFGTVFNDSFINAKKDNVFALVERSGQDFDDKIKTLSEELKIKFISYSPDSNHFELLEFLNYFTEPEVTEARYRRLVNVKKPTIVMLYCGGTIGGGHKAPLEEPLSVIKKKSRYDTGLAEFSTKLLSWYQNSYNAGNNLEIDIIWEILPEEFQMFSENATPKLWNVVRTQIENIIFKYFHAPEIPERLPNFEDPRLGELFEEESRQYALFLEESRKNSFSPEMLDNEPEELSYKRFSSEFKNRYILGVVILFGTDTLAYLAPALSFSLQHLPCPVVITGANQSPRELGIQEQTQYFARSDAWKNLIMSMYFLQCFGHRTREVFVCFGNTIHNCINLRKRAIELVPSGRPFSLNSSPEAFTYRNVCPHYQYMFKFIDGVFCNSYYHNFSVLLNPEVRDNIRHIRYDALEPTPVYETKGDDYSSVVHHVIVTPCFPPIDVKGALSVGDVHEQLRAVLVEGYPSGTYPTSLDNNFSHFLIELYEIGIPVILVSGYGILTTQQEYETIPVNGVSVPVLHLYGIIAETALPLVSMVVGQISAMDWEIHDKTENIIKRRIKLIRNKIAEFFEERPNIISEELQYVIKHDVSSQIKEHYKDLETTDLKRKNRIEKRRLSLPNLPRQLEKRLNFPPNFVALSHNDFKLLLNEFVRTFEQVGSGPDGFEILYNLGFDIGTPIFKFFAPPENLDNRSESDEGYILFSQRNQLDQQNALDIVNYRLEEVAKLLENSGAADVTIKSKVAINSTEPADSFSFRVSVKRYGRRERGDEKYAVMTFSDNEARFFQKLSYGCGDEQEINSFIGELKGIYNELLINTWKNSAQAIDWLILGIYKSIACEIARDLRFDRMAVDALTQAGVLNSLRQAVKVNIKKGDEKDFTVEFSYFERHLLDDENN